MSSDKQPITPEVRLAIEADLPAIVGIANQGIEEQATLDSEPRTLEERRQWLASHDARHPVFVALADGQVVGWASLNSFNPRPAYRFVADLSVYVERSWRGRGIGSALMHELIAQGRSLSYHKLVLATFTHSVALKMYEKLGFRTVGDYHEQGMLNDRWVDVRIMELIL